MLLCLRSLDRTGTLLNPKPRQSCGSDINSQKSHKKQKNNATPNFRRQLHSTPRQPPFRTMPSQPKSAETLILKAVNKNTIVIFSKSYCPYCQNTKALMKRNNWDAQVYELDHMASGALIQSQLHTMTGQATVPSVWINGVFLGGNSETQKAFQTGDLAKMMITKNSKNFDVSIVEN